MEAPKPVKGTLERLRADGTTETIEMTVDEVRAAPSHYDDYDCQNIIVTYDDDTRVRPYRFVDTQPNIRTRVDPETGELHGTI
jgi:hypothetical protein